MLFSTAHSLAKWALASGCLLSSNLWGQAGNKDPVVAQFGSAVGLSSPGFISIDVPGTIATEPSALNNSAAITGSVELANETYEAFVLDPTGVVTVFAAPGAGTQSGQGTEARGINASGTITGFYSDANEVTHGFVRTSSGVFSSFDVPNAGTQPDGGTLALAINVSGEIVGTYTDAKAVVHSFIRDPGGVIVAFDAPGAMFTFAEALNDAGVITGFFDDEKLEDHGFVRHPDGSVTTFDVSGPLNEPYTGTIAISVNAGGTITGYYSLPDPNYTAGFVRTPEGTVTTFGGKNQSVYPSSINASGVVTGFTSFNAFVRSPQGAIYPFHGLDQSTYGAIPSAINDSNAVTGSYLDPSDKLLGFLLIPQTR